MCATKFAWIMSHKSNKQQPKQAEKIKVEAAEIVEENNWNCEKIYTKNFLHVKAR